MNLLAEILRRRPRQPRSHHWIKLLLLLLAAFKLGKWVGRHRRRCGCGCCCGQREQDCGCGRGGACCTQPPPPPHHHGHGCRHGPDEGEKQDD